MPSESTGAADDWFKLGLLYNPPARSQVASWTNEYLELIEFARYGLQQAPNARKLLPLDYIARYGFSIPLPQGPLGSRWPQGRLAVRALYAVVALSQFLSAGTIQPGTRPSRMQQDQHDELDLSTLTKIIKSYVADLCFYESSTQ